MRGPRTIAERGRGSFVCPSSGAPSLSGVSQEEVLERIPNIEDDGLRGGVVYHDGQFDDASGAQPTIPWATVTSLMAHPADPTTGLPASTSPPPTPTSPETKTI